MNKSLRNWIYILSFIFLLIPFRGHSQNFPEVRRSSSSPQVSSDNASALMVINSDTIAQIREEARKTLTTQYNATLRYKVARQFPQILAQEGIPINKYLPRQIRRITIGLVIKKVPKPSYNLP